MISVTHFVGKFFVRLATETTGKISIMDDLESLELLSLVSKVTSELQNHLGISEKTLAEFLIAQRLESATLDEFKKKLAGVGAEFPASLVESIDRLVRTLHPKPQRTSAEWKWHPR
jgi:hypothetical protein